MREEIDARTMAKGQGHAWMDTDMEKRLFLFNGFACWRVTLSVTRMRCIISAYLALVSLSCPIGSSAQDEISKSHTLPGAWSPNQNESTKSSPSATQQTALPDGNSVKTQDWNWHIQNTTVVQGDFGVPAKYSGPHSLSVKGQQQDTFSLDLFAGMRLWHGGELHLDALVWQGFGLSHSFGIDAFPNGSAYKAGIEDPNYMFSHLFLRQTFGLGGRKEDVPNGQFTLSGKQDVSRVTVNVGRMSALDVFDHNAYAQDPTTQFMNWALMANLTWDYGQDTVGYGTGITLELNEPNWPLRYGLFLMPPYRNRGNVGSGDGGDDQILTWPPRGSYGPLLKSWSMAMELERSYSLNAHPGVIRCLAWLNRAKMDTYQAATTILLSNGPNADITSAEAYHYAYGLGLNWQQEITKNAGVFSRFGWNDGKTQALEFADANWSASLGVSVSGAARKRSGDNFGLAGVVSGISRDNQKFLAAGGLGILDGDGRLNYEPEKVIEAYYRFQIRKSVQVTLDYQYCQDLAFNRDRGPASIFGVRVHYEF